jgi:hypothetical protein
VLEIVAAAVVTTITRHVTASVRAVRSRAELCDVGPQGVDAGKTKRNVIGRQAEPGGMESSFW